ncbi:MAG TPA: MarR family transcriptional regulator [Solirubrobacteraceae bacterium]|nr:MarR family transcriptional regulator [Solirubrobacteraceae bacterium]
MSPKTATATAKPEVKPASKLDDLRAAVNQLLAADRRLRGRDHSRPGELTFAQVRTIAALGRGNEMTAGQLAKSADLTPATITTILDQLESANIVERRRSTEDRRVCNVALTPDGWQLLERKLADWQRLWAEHLSGYSDKELATATGIVQALTGMLDGLSSSLEPASSGDSA